MLRILLFASVLFLTGAAKAETQTEHFKKGCTDFIANRVTDDALTCVSVLTTAMELIVIFQAQGATKELNICIPHDPMHPPLVEDYAKLINQHPDLIDAKQPISAGLIKILAHVFPCANR